MTRPSDLASQRGAGIAETRNAGAGGEATPVEASVDSSVHGSVQGSDESSASESNDHRPGASSSARVGRFRPLRLPLASPASWWPRTIPTGTLIVFMVCAMLLGFLLSKALVMSTANTAFSTSDVQAADNQSTPALNSAGLPVVSETGLGQEVQKLVTTGSQPAPVSFDVALCMSRLKMTEPALLLEEIQWSPSDQHGWIIVHSPRTIQELRTNGGAVGALVVQSSCGMQNSSSADASILWNGSVMLMSGPV
ncbi:hypothetical protein [Devriesea agamarum]|uniref:hypothetical protein n=1 Tax=Devriesea agamarum TaxID=472569 RepID=UPI0012ECFBB2|nr:hypothetical protein [Devriesea agamarum]